MPRKLKIPEMKKIRMIIAETKGRGPTNRGKIPPRIWRSHILNLALKKYCTYSKINKNIHWDHKSKGEVGDDIPVDVEDGHVVLDQDVWDHITEADHHKTVKAGKYFYKFHISTIIYLEWIFELHQFISIGYILGNKSEIIVSNHIYFCL